MIKTLIKFEIDLLKKKISQAWYENDLKQSKQ